LIDKLAIVKFEKLKLYILYIIWYIYSKILSSFKNKEAVFNDFTCTRHYNRCKWRRRHVGHARY